MLASWSATWTNLTAPYWGSSWPALALLGLLSLRLSGYPLSRAVGAGIGVSLALVLGMVAARPHPYRALWADSANRMLLHLLPLVFFHLLLAYGEAIRRQPEASREPAVARPTANAARSLH